MSMILRSIPANLTALLLLLFSAAAAPAPRYASVDKAVVNFTALQPRQQAVAAVVVEIKPGFHAQSHTPSNSDFIAFEVKLEGNAALTFYEPVYPPGKNESYKSIDDKPLNVYSGTITIYLPFQVKPDAPAGPLKLAGKVHFQACDEGSCYPPTDLPFAIETKIAPAGEKVEPQNAEIFKNLPTTIFKDAVAPSPVPDAASEPGQKLFGRFELKHNSYLLAFLAAFIAGIIFNAVPCVLPVLPLKAIGFYEVSQHNRARCLAFGAVFSLGLIASFAALAVLIVVYKKVGWGEIYSNPWFNLAIVLILLVMAIGTFGAFSVNLPVGIYNITPRHDTYLGNFLFGILTAILSTPCTFGLFLGLLVWAASQPAAIGVSLVMTVGAGMAFPYFLLSAFPELARRFPRTGPWSELVKQLMSFLLLGSAVFFARRFIQPLTGPDAFWWTLFAVAALAGAFLVIRAVQITPKTTPRLVAFAIAAIVIGSTYLAVHALANQPFTWTPYSEEALASARKSNRLVVIDFTATWCSTCQYLEVHTLHTQEVVNAVKHRDVQMLKADLTSDSAAGWPLLRQAADFPAIPLTLVYGPASDRPIKLNGIYTPEQLIHALDEAAGAGKKESAGLQRTFQ